MSKNKPKETIEIVFRLQDKERQLASDFINSFQLKNVGQFIDNVGLKKAMSDPVDAILFVTSIATIIEMLGFETPIITPVDAGKLFKDPDGSTGLKGFWDVNLKKDFERFFGGN